MAGSSRHAVDLNGRFDDEWFGVGDTSEFAPPPPPTHGFGLPPAPGFGRVPIAATGFVSRPAAGYGGPREPALDLKSQASSFPGHGEYQHVVESEEPLPRRRSGTHVVMLKPRGRAAVEGGRGGSSSAGGAARPARSGSAWCWWSCA
ncbi:hypothetical protein ACP4OV_026110 [Aristida adscensionis]